jgi:hypothetical protein
MKKHLTIKFKLLFDDWRILNFLSKDNYKALLSRNDDLDIEKMDSVFKLKLDLRNVGGIRVLRSFEVDQAPLNIFLTNGR